MFDLAIKNGMLVLDGHVFQGTLWVKDGKVAAVSESGTGEAAETVDASGCYVLPGAIDPHSHLNDPGYTESEDFYTGSCSAAAGGFTTVLEMPISIPVPATAAILNEKKDILSKKAVVDFGLWGACIPDNSSDMIQMAESGAVGFKGFLTYSTHFPSINMGYIVKQMPAAAACGKPLAVHCETPEINDVFLKELQAQGRKDPAAHALSRPEISEQAAVAAMCAVTEACEGARLYIVHTSTAPAVELAQRARRAGAQVYVETCSHFLSMDTGAFSEHGPFAVCNPPLRSRGSVELLWQKVLAGEVDCLGSDHAPFLLEEKAGGAEDVFSIPAGFTSIQTCLPLIFDMAVNQRGMAVTDFARFTSTNAAKIFGLYPQKGSLRIGTDADITIINPKGKWLVKKEDLFYKEPWSPFIGREIGCAVRAAIVRGKPVFYDGKILADPGYGRYLHSGPAIIKNTI